MQETAETRELIDNVKKQITVNGKRLKGKEASRLAKEFVKSFYAQGGNKWIKRFFLALNASPLSPKINFYSLEKNTGPYFGFYSPDTKTLYLPLSESGKIPPADIIKHEYTHAVFDACFNNVMEPYGKNDTAAKEYQKRISQPILNILSSEEKLDAFSRRLKSVGDWSAFLTFEVTEANIPKNRESEFTPTSDRDGVSKKLSSGEGWSKIFSVGCVRSFNPLMSIEFYNGTVILTRKASLNQSPFEMPIYFALPALPWVYGETYSLIDYGILNLKYGKKWRGVGEIPCVDYFSHYEVSYEALGQPEVFISDKKPRVVTKYELEPAFHVFGCKEKILERLIYDRLQYMKMQLLSDADREFIAYLLQNGNEEFVKALIGQKGIGFLDKLLENCEAKFLQEKDRALAMKTSEIANGAKKGDEPSPKDSATVELKNLGRELFTLDDKWEEKEELQVLRGEDYNVKEETSAAPTLQIPGTGLMTQVAGALKSGVQAVAAGMQSFANKSLSYFVGSSQSQVAPVMSPLSEPPSSPPLLSDGSESVQSPPGDEFAGKPLEQPRWNGDITGPITLAAFAAASMKNRYDKQKFKKPSAEEMQAIEKIFNDISEEIGAVIEINKLEEKVDRGTKELEEKDQQIEKIEEEIDKEKDELKIQDLNEKKEQLEQEFEELEKKFDSENGFYYELRRLHDGASLLFHDAKGGVPDAKKELISVAEEVDNFIHSVKSNATEEKVEAEKIAPKSRTPYALFSNTAKPSVLAGSYGFFKSESAADSSNPVAIPLQGENMEERRVSFASRM